MVLVAEPSLFHRLLLFSAVAALYFVVHTSTFVVLSLFSLAVASDSCFCDLLWCLNTGLARATNYGRHLLCQFPDFPV